MKKKALIVITILLVQILVLSISALAATSPISVELPIAVNGSAVVELKAEEGTSDEFDDSMAVIESGTFVLTYDEPGLYVYHARQIAGDDSTVTYDETVYEVRIFVESDDDGVLYATVVSNVLGDTTKDTTLAFSNRQHATTCSIDPPIKKLIATTTGSAPLDSVFSFMMMPGTKDTPMPTANFTADRDNSTGSMTITVRGPGEYEFGEIVYDLDDLGANYSYTISEVDTKEAGYTYDTSKYTLNVNIVLDENSDLVANTTLLDEEGQEVDEVVFTNLYSPEKAEQDKTSGKSDSSKISVQTGISDYAGIISVCLAVLLAVAVILYIIVVVKDKRKKKSDDNS